MRSQQYPVHLTETDRAELLALVKTGQAPARTIWHAQVLLLSDSGKNDSAIAEVLHIAPITVKRIRKTYSIAGVAATLHDKPRSGAPRRFDGDHAAAVVALACTSAPEGHARWTTQLLADHLIKLQVVDSISDETVRCMLKKTRLNRGAKSSGASPA